MFNVIPKQIIAIVLMNMFTELVGVYLIVTPTSSVSIKKKFFFSFSFTLCRLKQVFKYK